MNQTPWRKPKTNHARKLDRDRKMYQAELEVVGTGNRRYVAMWEPLKPQEKLPVRPGADDWKELPSLK